MRVAVWTLAVLVVIMLGYLGYDQLWPSGHGTLFVASDPPGAQIWVDLQPTDARTNGRVANVLVGKHSVMVKLDTLEADPVAQVVEVRRGQTDSAHFRLTPPVFASRQAVASILSDRMPGVPPMQSSPTTRPPDTLSRVKRTQPSDQPEHTAQPLELPTATGVLEIATSVPGAKVFVNEKEQRQTAPTSIKLPSGNYVVRVQLDGYASDPADQTVSVLRGSPIQSISFTLTPEATSREISVETLPFAGKILINDQPAGVGKITVPREYGSYTVTFGDSQGWRTPEPQHVSITPSQPRVSVKAVYTRTFRASAEAASGTVVSQGAIHYQTGAYFEDEGAHPSAGLGPKIRAIPNSSKFGWELAEGDNNRNPTGGGYVEFSFTLPPDADPKTPLSLRLYLYRSSRRYAFSLSGNSEIVVTVNGHRFLDGFRPQNGTETADEGRYEEWSLQGMLSPGENRIMVRSGEHNSLFHYLWKIEIL